MSISHEGGGASKNVPPQQPRGVPVSKSQGNGFSSRDSSAAASPCSKRRKPVYEVVAGQPTWGRLSRLAAENVADLATKAIVNQVKIHGRSECKPQLSALRDYLLRELPSSIAKEVLDLCLARDRFRCHHSPTDCLALEYWRVFYNSHVTDVSVIHHEFAFPKTSNYPEIVDNLKHLLELISSPPPPPPDDKNASVSSSSSTAVVTADKAAAAATTTTSFKLELKHCEMGFYLEDQVLSCLPRFTELRVMEIPGLATDKLLHVIACYCTNLEVLNLQGSRDMVSDAGFATYVATSTGAAGDNSKSEPGQKRVSKLKQLDVSRCSLSQQSLLPLQRLTVLRELKVSTTLLDDINYSCDGSVVMVESGEQSSSSMLGDHLVDRLSLPSVAVVTVENDSYVQISINKVMSCLKNVFPAADRVQLVNCVACELHVTLTQHPTNITYMRETIHSLELISADYFNFPRLVYPCPNLESLAIEKPTNDVFNIDQQHVPFLYGNTVPFINLKHLKLSRISLTNLTHFLSNSRALKKFKVTNIGRRERPRWTDQRIRQIFPPDSVPCLEDFHVSCLPSEGFSTSDTHRYLHLTGATVAYLTENFPTLKRIAGIESWTPADCNSESLNAMLNTQPDKPQFSVFSI